MIRKGDQAMELIHNDDAVVLAFGNTYEFNERYNSGLPTTDLVTRRRLKESFGISGDLALFWGGIASHRVVVTPQKPNSVYMRYLEEQLDVSITALTPRLRTGWVCRDLLSDGATMSRLVAAIGGRSVRVLAWGATADYYALLDTLRERGVQIVHHDFPAVEDRWVVDYCDSKTGARALLQHMTPTNLDIQVPPGFICHNLAEAGGLASFLHAHHVAPVVIKSDWGNGGKAVRILNSDAHGQTFATVWARFVSEVQGDALWDHSALTVEECVGLGQDLTTPSVDGYIDSGGTVHVLGVQNMLTIEQRCVGFEMGNNVFPHDLESRLRSIVKHVGDQLSLFGYRGWFDIDFLLPNDGSLLFISEINPRRTGGSSPLAFASKRLGDSWSDAYHLKVNERLELSRPTSIARLMNIVLDLNARYSSSSAEIIPLHVRGLSLRQPYVGYVIYARTKEVALEIEEDFISAIRRVAESVNAKTHEPATISASL